MINDLLESIYLNMIENVPDFLIEGTPSKRLARLAKGADALSAAAEKEGTDAAHLAAVKAHSQVSTLARKGKQKRTERGDTEAASDYDKVQRAHDKAEISHQNERGHISAKSSNQGDDFKTSYAKFRATQNAEGSKAHKRQQVQAATSALANFNTQKEIANRRSKHANALTQKVGENVRHTGAEAAHDHAATDHSDASLRARRAAQTYDYLGHIEKAKKMSELADYHAKQAHEHQKRSISHKQSILSRAGINRGQ